MPFVANAPLGWPVWLFLALMVAVCAGAVASRRALMGGEDLPPPGQLYFQVGVQLLVVLGVALLAARSAGIEVFVVAAPPGRAALAGALGLALMLASVPVAWRFTSDEERARRAQFLPRSAGETAGCLVVAGLAGFCEEIAWRAVLPAIVAHWTGGVLVPILVSAAAFGVGHMVQGKLASTLVFGFALLFHGLVWVTGDLWTVIVVHAVYDALVAAWLGPLFHRRHAAAA